MKFLFSFLFLLFSFTTPTHALQCERGGCSGEICAPKGSGIASPCMWQEKFACYKTAVCEPQRGRGGKRVCGWRDTPQLQQCLQKADGKTVPSTNPPAPIRNVQ